MAIKQFVSVSGLQKSTALLLSTTHTASQGPFDHHTYPRVCGSIIIDPAFGLDGSKDLVRPGFRNSFLCMSENNFLLNQFQLKNYMKLNPKSQHAPVFLVSLIDKVLLKICLQTYLCSQKVASLPGFFCL